MKNISLDRCTRIGLILLVTGIFQIPLFAQMSDMPEPAAAQAGDLNVGFNRPPSAGQILSEAKAEPSLDLHDHLAKIYQVFGDVKILKKGQADWVHAFPNMTLEEGDQILTGSDSYLDIAYDAKFLNVARIQANTKAEFRSIEPTDLILEDGSIFNVLDGLNGERYQISTPTAVAGVRGTTFLANSNGIFDVYPDKSSHMGEVYVQLNEGGKVIDLVEGQAFDATAPDQGVTDIPQERMAGAEEIMEAVYEFRPDSTSFESAGTSGADQESKEDSTDDQKKAGDGPNDDGDSSGLKETDSTDAQFRDSMSEDSLLASEEGSGENGEFPDTLADNLIPEKDDQTNDMNAVVDFFAAGGMDFSGKDSAGGAEGSEGHPEFRQVLENMGMEDMGEKFENPTEAMGSYEPAGGETGGSMENNMGETYTFDSSGTEMGAAGYTDPGSAGFDPSQFIDPQTFLPPNPAEEVKEAIKEETQSSGDDPNSGSGEGENGSDSGNHFVTSGG